MLALTWDFRTFEGTDKIRKFLEDRLTQANVRNIKLSQETPPVLSSPFPDLVWIQLLFTFDTDVGGCTGVARLVPVAKTGETKWKAHTVYTRLESLHGVSELLGPGRKSEPYHGPWDQIRAEEAAYKDREPTVIVVGAGQSGLGVAANLKVLGVDTLVIEKSERVGDNWRKRYEALCLHDPVCEFGFLEGSFSYPLICIRRV
jgi:phosphoglycerate dehydrogenase-like enzyme